MKKAEIGQYLLHIAVRLALKKVACRSLPASTAFAMISKSLTLRLTDMSWTQTTEITSRTTETPDQVCLKTTRTLSSQ